MKYEIAITGSSRPSVYPIFWESFNKMVKMKEPSKITVYEDVIIKEKSNEVKKFIEKKVDRYIEINPNKRLGKVFDMLIENIKSEYYLYLQEDWKFLNEIDLDLLIEIMDKNPKIQQIWFPKLLQNDTYNNYCFDTVNFDGVYLTKYISWAFLPHIARTSFVKDLWKKGNVRNHTRPESPFKRVMEKYNISDVSYILGKKHDIYIEHLGINRLRTREMIERRGH